MQIARVAKCCLVAAAIFLAAIAVNPGPAHAGTALIGVASNFRDVMDDLKAEFEQSSGHELKLSVGSTGTLYAQITHGAPIDIFLAADRERPRLLEQKNKIVAGSRFTYATGLLSLWSRNPELIDTDASLADIEHLLRTGTLHHLAIANPRLAPYGAATMEVLHEMKLDSSSGPEIVMGENIGQAFALVASGNAELGFVALSSVIFFRDINPGSSWPGSSWNVPSSLYTPIQQDGVLLKRAENNAAALAFIAYLKSPEARQIIAASGYGPGGD